MSYLDQGIANSFCKVIQVSTDLNYAIFISPDGSVITCEKSALLPGIYRVESETPESDTEIANSIDILYNVMYNNMVLHEYIALALEKLNPSIFYKVFEVPKMTKALAQSMASVKEAMVICEEDDCYRYLCIGYRRKIAEVLEAIDPDKASIYLFSDNFFTACSFGTRFKPDNIYLSDFRDFIVLTNDTKTLDKVSLVGTVEWKTHSDYIEKDFING